jgi:hypothetical protein
MLENENHSGTAGFENTIDGWEAHSDRRNIQAENEKALATKQPRLCSLRRLSA